MESIAVLVYRIVEKELIDDREAAMSGLVAAVQPAVTACRPKTFKLIKSTTTDAGKKHSDQTVYRLHVALEDVFSLGTPAYEVRKERLEVALRAAPDVRNGRIDLELEEENVYSLDDYVEHFGAL
ncbi:hypothetical protein HY497_02240 [Candidatus Woesearchaeota archaeon]|nr:hypothetical protein [Candidatus Woesearchaeota archaeon]